MARLNPETTYYECGDCGAEKDATKVQFCNDCEMVIGWCCIEAHICEYRKAANE